MAKRRKGSKKRTKKARARARRSFFGSGIHRPRLAYGGHAFRMRPKSPYRGQVRRINRRHNPMLAEYLLGNPRHRRRHGGRRHHNPLGMQSLTNPVPLLIQGASGLGGILTPVVIGNLLTGYIAPMVPMLQQPGILGSIIRAGIRLGVATMVDPFIRRIPGIDDDAFRKGEYIGIAGSFVMDLLGRPLLIGPGDTGMTTGYLFGGMGTPAAAGAGAYFNRKLVGTGAYFQKNRMAGMDALVPVPRMRGVNGVGAGLRTGSGANDLFTPY